MKKEIGTEKKSPVPRILTYFNQTWKECYRTKTLPKFDGNKEWSNPIDVVLRGVNLNSHSADKGANPMMTHPQRGGREEENEDKERGRTAIEGNGKRNGTIVLTKDTRGSIKDRNRGKKKKSGGEEIRAKVPQHSR